jgi:hypothetical protein
MRPHARLSGALTTTAPDKRRASAEAPGDGLGHMRRCTCFSPIPGRTRWRADPGAAWAARRVRQSRGSSVGQAHRRAQWPQSSPATLCSVVWKSDSLGKARIGCSPYGNRGEGGQDNNQPGGGPGRHAWERCAGRRRYPGRRSARLHSPGKVKKTGGSGCRRGGPACSAPRLQSTSSEVVAQPDRDVAPRLCH